MLRRFEWDAVKAAGNRRKHGVSFDTASLVFADPLALSRLSHIEDGEERWQTLGTVSGQLLLLVAHTVREEEDEQPIEVIRIISARKADKKERFRYAQETR